MILLHRAERDLGSLHWLVPGSRFSPNRCICPAMASSYPYLRKAAIRVGSFLALAAMLASSHASAQLTDNEAAQKPAESVIVTGQRQNETIDTVVSQFVDTHAAPNRKTGQYMRDDVGPICPETIGLPPAFDSFVTKRVLGVAASVGAKTDASGSCIPNVEILFTNQPDEIVKSLAEKTRGAILGVHYVHETQQLMEMTHPIQAWYVSGTWFEGTTIAPVMSLDTSGNVGPGVNRRPKLDSAYRRAPDRVVLGSRIPERRVSSILNVLILVDLNKLGGHEIGPVSDYVAMLALSEPQSLDECNALPSILDLMADCGAREKPQSLTASDMAYLKGLYAADLGAWTNSTQKSSIAGGMKTNLSDH